ncbi:HipA family kinase [Ralstonia sp. Ralssp110]|uniref:HipA family kinase n=1 Tax=Ralstonia sp. Ralssp110 TaxID=3243004 RepID=UPI0039B473C1
MINGAVVTIVEILGRAVQGATMPFRCRGDDGNIYFVKGRHAGRRAQICEWIGCTLAREFGLPVAPFAVVDVPEPLIAISPPAWRELGTGLAFGSAAIPFTLEFSLSNIEKVPLGLQQDLLAFDWWILNQDRQLTAFGGNPNLLWSARDTDVSVIDHNLAFDTAFDVEVFRSNHVFAAQWDTVYSDWIIRQRIEQKCAQAHGSLDVAWDRMPDEWWWAGDGVPADIDRTFIETTLARFTRPDFWG